MNKNDFVKQVQHLAPLPSPEMAEEATRVVLSIFSHRLTPEESRHITDQLTSDMKSFWKSDTWIVNFLSLSKQYQLKYRKKAELYSLIENEITKLGFDVSAEQLTLAVFHVLKDQISTGEIEDVAAQLPEEIEQVWLAA